MARPKSEACNEPHDGASLMGMYDTINVPCPNCGKTAEFQTKSGPCNLDVYDLYNVPVDVLMDVNRHAPATCAACGTLFEVKFRVAVMEARSVIVARDAGSKGTS